MARSVPLAVGLASTLKAAYALTIIKCRVLYSIIIDLICGITSEFSG